MECATTKGLIGALHRKEGVVNNTPMRSQHVECALFNSNFNFKIPNIQVERARRYEVFLGAGFFDCAPARCV